VTLLKRHTDVLGGYEIGKGGGIIRGFNPLNPFRGWRTYQVVATHEDDAGAELPIVVIRKSGGPITDTIAQVQARTGGGFVPKTWFHPSASGMYPALGWYFLDPATEAFVAGPLLPLGNVALGNLSEDTRKVTPITSHVLQWFEMTPPTGPYIGFLVSRDPSPEHPLFVSGHPVEIVADLLTRKGEAYNAASAAAVTASLGAELQHVVPYTSGDETPQDVIDALSAAYGFTIRRHATTGEAEFIHWREKLSVLPTPTIGINDVRADGGPTFDLSSATRLTRVKISGQTLVPWSAGAVTMPRLANFFPNQQKVQQLKNKVALASTDKPASGISIIQSEIAFDFSQDGVTLDSEVYGESEATVEVVGQPGLLNTVAGGASAFSFEQWAEGVARLYFDGNSRGRVMATVPCLRETDADDLGIGDAVTLDLPHMPNAQLGQTPTSQRGGPRPFRVTSVNPELPGNVLTCADEGTGVQYATVPDISVAPDAVQPDLLVVTIDNADDLTADGAQVEFQVRAVADGDTIDLSDPGLRYTVDDATDWTLNPMLLRFGPFPIGHTIYVRARAWLVGGSASSWSSWFSIGGEVTGPQTTLSDLVISNLTDEGADLSWSYDEGPPVGDVKVQYRLAGGGGYTTFSTLSPGTETETLTGLTPGTAYDVRIVLDDSGEYGDVLLGTFTTLGGAISSLTLGTPTPSSVALSWTNTDATHAVRIQKKLDTASVYELVIDLPAGSTGYTLTGLIPETDYDVRVVLVSDGLELGSALLDSFTTDLAANQTQLDTPTGAAVFEGWNPAATPPASSPGTYGLQVTAVFGPPDMEIVFKEALETAPGSGLFGSYSEVAQIPAVVGDFTRYIATAPNDGLLRSLQAFARASGFLDSDATAPLSADPWPATPTVPPDDSGSGNIEPGIVNGDFALWDPVSLTYRPGQIVTDADGLVVTDSNGDVVTSFR
jgi:hypothetical protein